ncbi:MAG: UxaA family hydrolase [Ferrovibrio sp.]|uniref:UxaA family hydrolase n=1 Tax=Ferrovibrio sp. TaxID=1917215 RepID=UPI00391DF196
MASSDLATDPRLLMLAPGDNIAVARLEIPAGTELQVAGATVRLQRALGFGHKIALRNIAVGERIVKYGAPIGRATADIALGEYVHNHNVASDYMPNTVAVEAAP